MANEVLIDKLVSPEALKQLEDLNKRLNDTISIIEKANKATVVGGGAKTTDEAVKQQQALIREQEKLNQLKTEAGNIALKQQQVVKEEIKNQQLIVKSQNEAINAYDRQQAKVSLLEKRVKDLALTRGLEHKATQRMIEIHNQEEKKLRDVDMAMNNHKRNVGNYEGAVVGLRTQIRALTQTLGQMELQGKNNSTEYKAMVMQLGKLKDAMGDVSARAKFFADDQRYVTGLTQALQGMIGAYSAYVAAVGLVAGEDEDLAKSMQKLMQLMVLMNGIQQLSTALNKDSAASVMIQVAADKIKSIFTRKSAVETAAATAATEADTVATNANTTAKTLSRGPIVALIVAIAALAVGFYKMVKENNANAIATRKANEAWQEYIEYVNKVIENNESLVTSMENLSNAMRNVGAIRIADQIDVMKELATIMELAPFLMASTSKEAQKLGAEVVNIAANFWKFNKSAATDMIIKLSELKNNLSSYGNENKTLPPIIDKIIAALGNESKALTTLDENANKNKKTIKSNKDALKFLNDELKKTTGLLSPTAPDGGLVTLTTKYTGAIEEQTIKFNELKKKVEEYTITEEELNKRLGETDVNFETRSQRFRRQSKEISDYAGQLSELLGEINDLYSIQSDNVLKGIESRTEAELKSLQSLYDNGIIAQTEYEARKKAIEDEAANKKEAAARKEFERNKKFQMTMAAINFAAMQLNIWATVQPWYAALAESLAAGILATLQIEKIRTSTYSGYAKGRIGGDDEMAFVGEKGFEYISTPTGQLYKTPNTTTLTHLGEGYSVFPHEVSKQIDKYVGMPSVSQVTKANTGSTESRMILSELQKLNRKPTSTMNIDRNGFDIMLGNINQKQRLIDKHLRHTR